MKRFLIAFLAFLMVFSVFGCEKNGGQKETTSEAAGGESVASPSYLLKDGLLQIGSEIGYPPFEMFDEDGKTVIGLDAELGRAIGKILGVEVKFIDAGFDGILGGLKAEKYDIVMSAVTITADRAKEVDFSDPYIENWQAIAVKKGTTPITSIKDLEGKKLGYQEGTTSKAYISLFIDKKQLTCEEFEYPKIINCFDDLRQGRVDAVLCDSVVADRYVADEPEVFEVTWNQKDIPDEEPELFGIAVRQGNSVLLGKINEALAQLEADGTMDALRTTWLAAGDAE